MRIYISPAHNVKLTSNVPLHQINFQMPQHAKKNHGPGDVTLLSHIP